MTKLWSHSKIIVFTLLITVTFSCCWILFWTMFYIDLNHEGFVSVNALRTLGLYSDQWGTYTGYWYSNSHLHPFYVFSKILLKNISFLSMLTMLLWNLVIHLDYHISRSICGNIYTISFACILLFGYLFDAIVMNIYYFHDKGIYPTRVGIVSYVNFFAFLLLVILLIVDLISKRKKKVIVG